MARSLARSVVAAVVGLVLTAAPALAQTPTPTPTGEPTIAKAPAPWTYYMAIATIGIAGLTLLMVLLGYMLQAPGFRRGEGAGRGTASS